MSKRIHITVESGHPLVATFVKFIQADAAIKATLAADSDGGAWMRKFLGADKRRREAADELVEGLEIYASRKLTATTKQGEAA